MINLSTKKTFDGTKNYVVHYSDNWADEMDIEGFRIMSGSELNDYIKFAKLVFKEDGYYDYHIGTNQEITYENFGIFASNFEIHEISDEEYKVLDKLELGYCGMFPDNIGEGYEDEEETTK